MTRPGGDRERMRQAKRLRSAWRRRDGGGGSVGGPSDDASESARETEALDANDRLRAEAPDDLETRRRADQIEREIRDSRRERPGG